MRAVQLICQCFAALRIVGLPGFIAFLFATLMTACSNNPYPPTQDNEKVLYSSYSNAPKTLDPAKAYTTTASIITDNVFDTLLEYHYRARPYRLIPGLSKVIPKPTTDSDGKTAFRFPIREDVEFHEDPCFPPNPALDGRRTRTVTAADFAFQLMRIADPKLNSPIRSNFTKIDGFASFTQRLKQLRESEKAFILMPAHEQYRMAGGIAGVRANRKLELEIRLTEADPQILYWFALPFTTPQAWEAIAYYDGQNGRTHLADHPVGTGPFKLTTYDKQFRMILERNPYWYGKKHPDAPGATMPAEGDPNDVSSGVIDARSVGQSVPFLQRIEYRREKESIPVFNKLLQGYYDGGGIIKESFDTVIQNDRLSPEMKNMGMRLSKTIEPSISYIGFNMLDPVVGAKAGSRSRKLRQAMSLVIDSKRYLELFKNNRGVPAQSPLPPGLFGYDPDYKNPYRQVDIAKAKALLAEAGYTGGIDPDTGQPLKLTFDAGNPSSRAKLIYEFFVDAWRQLGIDVSIAATNYTQFQDKVRKGSYQIYTWGWLADYPDPENFLFLLQGAMARSLGNGPNSANFQNTEYDRLFELMKDRTNDNERLRIISQMRDIVERERPWIELHHSEAYQLSHGWLKNAKAMGIFVKYYKYYDVDVDAGARAKLRKTWNNPVMWPAYLLILLLIAVIVPGIVTFYKERQ